MAQEGRSRKQKRIDCPTDFISELPRDVIDAILERLPVHDAAKLSVLSHMWLGIWKSIQTLTFDYYSILTLRRIGRSRVVDPLLISIVSNILFYHEGNLLRFRLHLHPYYTSFPDINPWICYLSRKGVSEITIEYEPTVIPFKLSSHIFSCGNLEKLKLPCMVINPPPSFRGFSKMTCLQLDQPTFNKKSLNSLIKNCPLLMELSLTHFTVMEDIVINAPNLRSLTVDGTFKSLDVRNAANLVSAVFGLQKCVELRREELHALLETLANSPNLQTLCFRGYICKALYKNSLMQTRIEQVRDLELSLIPLNNMDDFSSVIRTIQNCPAIRRVYITLKRKVRKSKVNVTSVKLQYKRDFVLVNLSYAKVQICSGSMAELKLIEFLLNCAPILDELSVPSTLNNSTNTILGATGMKKLRSFHRASQKVKLKLSRCDSDSSWLI